MYHRMIPTSDPARDHFLQATATAHYIDITAGRQRLRTETGNKAQSLAQQFQQARADAQRAKERAKRARRLARENISTLEGSLKTVWKLVRQRVHTGKLPSELLAHYGLPQSGPLPRPGERKGWLPLAIAAIQGHYAAEAAGLPVLDISEVVQELPDAQRAVTELKTILDAEKDVQAQQRVLRNEVTTLARAVSMELRRSLMEQPASTRRAIMRSYGFAFDPVKPKTSGVVDGGEAE